MHMHMHSYQGQLHCLEEMRWYSQPSKRYPDARLTPEPTLARTMPQPHESVRCLGAFVPSISALHGRPALVLLAFQCMWLHLAV